MKQLTMKSTTSVPGLALLEETIPKELEEQIIKELLIIDMDFCSGSLCGTPFNILNFQSFNFLVICCSCLISRSSNITAMNSLYDFNSIGVTSLLRSYYPSFPQMQQLTIQLYPPGTGIPPHVESHTAFGDVIVVFSLGARV